MDYKYIEQLLERYFNAETTFEEENILRSFFTQETIPVEMEQWRALFTAADDEVLGDDFDVRMLKMVADSEKPAVKACEISLTSRLAPLFKAAAVVAIVVAIGGALQAPWDSSWSTPQHYADIRANDSVAVVSPVQAENYADRSADSTVVLEHTRN